MGSHLHAFVCARADVLELGAAQFRSRHFALSHGLFLLPLPVDALAADYTVASLGFNDLSAELAQWAEDASAEARIAYLENQTFAGEGMAGACIWAGKTLVWGPRFTSDVEMDRANSYEWTPDHRDSAVNVALRELGVDASGYHDEYAALGLDARRTTEDWLQ
jgi:hypothetical protein